MERFRSSLSGREKFGYVVVSTIFVILFIGLLKLQIVEHADLAAQSETNRIRVQPIIPARGLVYDRDSQINH